MAPPHFQLTPLCSLRSSLTFCCDCTAKAPTGVTVLKPSERGSHLLKCREVLQVLTGPLARASWTKPRRRVVGRQSNEPQLLQRQPQLPRPSGLQRNRWVLRSVFTSDRRPGHFLGGGGPTRRARATSCTGRSTDTIGKRRRKNEYPVPYRYLVPVPGVEAYRDRGRYR